MEIKFSILRQRCQLYWDDKKKTLVLRKQWLPLFDDATSIIFIASLSEFDQKLEEDEYTYRTAESLFLFKAILKLEAFRKTDIILFLNKKDLLAEKLDTEEKVNKSNDINQS